MSLYDSLFIVIRTYIVKLFVHIFITMEIIGTQLLYLIIIDYSSYYCINRK